MIQLRIPGCASPADLHFGYLNLRDHPRGTLMLSALLDAGFRPALVLEEDSDLATAGRQSQLRQLRRIGGYTAPPPTAALCVRHDIPYETVGNHNDPVVADRLRQSSVDIAVLGDVRILKPHIIASVPHGIINVHPGYLPDVRGNNPYIWSIVYGLPLGVSAHLIDAGVDRGPLFAAWQLTVAPGITLPQLILELHEKCAEMIVDVLHRVVRGEAAACPQPDDTRLTFRKAPPEVWALAEKLLRDKA